MNEDTGSISREQKYFGLVDEFYQHNKNVVSEEEYERAKTDLAQFKPLIRKVTDLCQSIGKELLLKDRNYHVWEKQFKRQR